LLFLMDPFRHTIKIINPIRFRNVKGTE
jgi:hypothetical protein